MCGVVACFWHDEADEQTIEADRRWAVVRAGVQALARRGPDSSSMTCLHRNTVGLGHARLSLVGGHDGQQPYVSARGAGVVNGELYQHERYHKTLNSLNENANGVGDCGVLLELLHLHGIDHLQQLPFEGAGVWVENNGQTAWLFRDRFGVKPLVFAQVEQGIMVASQAKSLFAAGWVVPRWDQVSLQCAVSEQYLDEGSTLFHGVQSVPPGGWLQLKRQGKRWVIGGQGLWDDGAWLPADRLIQPEPEEAVEMLHNVLAQAVYDRCRNTGGRFAVHVSGGVDSSWIAALAASNNPVAVSVLFSEGGAEAYNEADWAQAAARHIGVEWSPLDVTRQECVAHWGRAIWDAEGLAINSHLSAKWLLNRHISQMGIRVVLSGEGADEMALGYSHLGRDHALQMGRVWKAADETAAMSRAMDVTRQEPPPSWLAAKTRNAGWLSPWLMRPEMVQRRAVHMNGDHLWVHQSAQMWNRRALSGYILSVLGDGTEACFGMEGRPAYLDARVFQLVRGWHPDVWMKGVGKAALRKAAARYLPSAMARRPKHPFEAPPLLQCPDATRQILEIVRETRGVLNGQVCADELWAISKDSELSAEREPAVAMALSLSIVEKLMKTHWDTP